MCHYYKDINRNRPWERSQSARKVKLSPGMQEKAARAVLGNGPLQFALSCTPTSRWLPVARRECVLPVLRAFQSLLFRMGLLNHENSRRLSSELSHSTSWPLVVFNFSTIGAVHVPPSPSFMQRPGADERLVTASPRGISAAACDGSHGACWIPGSPVSAYSSFVLSSVPWAPPADLTAVWPDSWLSPASPAGSGSRFAHCHFHC